MNGEYLLDSSIIIGIFRGDSSVISVVAEIKIINVPVIALGELYYGANLSGNSAKRISEINQMERKVNIFDVNISTTRFYGKIKHQLKRKGTPIPENDIWIAAISLEHQFTL